MLESGTIFARDYRVVSPLGEGGMGTVYVVEQISTGKQRALKVMMKDLVWDERQRERFEQEARIGSRIRSEHVVSVLAAGVESGQPYIVMELLEGSDLSKWKRRAMGDARKVLRETCHALGAAHAAGIVHRDIKPENIFVARSLRAGADDVMVKVLDFGIAKLVDEARTTTKTASLGTPLWMSPEQTETQPRLSPACDVWALGLVAFFVVTGKMYWRVANVDSGSPAALMRELLYDPMPAASERSRELGGEPVPAGFDAWFARATARDQTKRYVDATAAWAALEPLFDAAKAVPATIALPTPPPPAPRTGLAIAGGIFLLLVMLGAGSIMGVRLMEKKPVAVVTAPASTTAVDPPIIVPQQQPTVTNVTTTPTSDITWNSATDEARARAEAVHDGKRFFIAFCSETVKECRTLEDTYQYREVKSQLKRMVIVRVDTTSENATIAALKRKYDVKEIPTLIVFDSKGIEAVRMSTVTDPGLLGTTLYKIK